MKKKIKLKPDKSDRFLEPAPGDIIREYYYTETWPKKEIEIGQWLVLGRRHVINEELFQSIGRARLYYCRVIKVNTDISWVNSRVGQTRGIISQRFNSNKWEVVVESGLSWEEDKYDME